MARRSRPLSQKKPHLSVDTIVDTSTSQQLLSDDQKGQINSSYSDDTETQQDNRLEAQIQIDYAGPEGLCGWAWIRARPDAHLTVELWNDDCLIMSRRANLYREHLRSAGIGNGAHAFIMPFQPKMLDPSNRLYIRCRDHDYISHTVTVEISDPGDIAKTPPLSDFALMVSYDEEFDADYYRHIYPDTLTQGLAPHDHFLEVGASEGRSPNIWFSPRAYLEKYEDVLESGANPFLHYLAHGRAEKRTHIHPCAPEDMATLLPSLDVEYYRNEYKHDISAVDDPLIDYLTTGWRRGRNPAPWFSTANYLLENPALMQLGTNPFIHYLNSSTTLSDQGSTPPSSNISMPDHVSFLQSAFSTEHYNQQLGAVLTSTEAIAHYLLNGSALGLDPSPEFSTIDYLNSYPDVLNAGINPFVHYLRHGKAEGRHPNRRTRSVLEPEFDVSYYLSHGVDCFGLDPLDHYMAFGWRQGFDPAAYFSIADYLRLYPDVRGAEPFYHFLMHGRHEGRSPKIQALRKIKPSTSRPAVLFVGHDGIKAGAQGVLLELVRWCAQHTRLRLKVLLLAPGALSPAFAAHAETVVLNESIEDLTSKSVLPPSIRRFLADDINLCYINTVAASCFWRLLERHIAAKAKPKIILHIHELKDTIRLYRSEFVQMEKRTDKIIAVSKAVEEALTSEFSVKVEKILVSRPFVAGEPVGTAEIGLYRQRAREKLNLDEGTFLILACGTVYERKGVDYFIETAGRIIEQRLVPNAIFVWIGEGPDLERHKEEVEKPLYQGRVQFLGFQEQAQNLIAGADVFFLPSREDPYPLVCLEAALFSIPILHFHGMTGIDEFATLGASVSIPSFDIDAAAGAVTELYRWPKRREQVGVKARAQVLQEHLAENQARQLFLTIRDLCKVTPDVSVIVPVYNHERFLRQRIESVVNQTIQDLQIILLDDASSDRSVELMESYSSDPRIAIVVNSENSGSPFQQWALGASMSTADVIWIAEGDDHCSLNFVETLLPSFDDSRTHLAFAETKIIDELGIEHPHALQSYYRNCEFPFEQNAIEVEGTTAVELGFGAMCLIVNSSAAMMRKHVLTPAWNEIRKFEMCGDWYAYLKLLEGGSVFYTRAATNFFRRHSASVVHKIEGTPRYFFERYQISELVLSKFLPGDQLVSLMLAMTANEWTRFKDRNNGAELSEHYDYNLLRRHWMMLAARPRMKIGFYVHGMKFSKGGIERLAAQLSDELVRMGHSVTIFCRAWADTGTVYPVNRNITICDVFDENDLLSSVQKLRISIARAGIDVFVPMLSEWLFEPIIDAVRPMEIPIIASEHNDPWEIQKKWWNSDRRALYFSDVHAVHFLLKRFLPSVPDDVQRRATVIPNGLKLNRALIAQSVSNRPKRIIGVGRLEPQKRFDRLIRAFSNCASQLPEWRVDIFGEGSERNALQELIDMHGLSDVIFLRGMSNTILQEYARSAIFVMPSDFEGFGIVVLEAQMAGLPCVAYKHCNGPNELIHHEVDGLLLPDETEERCMQLAAAIMTLARDQKARETMGAAGRLGIAQYDIKEIAGRWEALLLQTISQYKKHTTGCRTWSEASALPTETNH